MLDHFWNDVYRFQLKQIKNEYEAEDITIESFSKAFDKINTFDEKYLFKTWLITISKNIHIDLIRRNKKSINTTTSEDQEAEAYKIVDNNPTPEDNLITEQNLAKLLEDIKQLKPKYQEVIHLRFFKESLPVLDEVSIGHALISDALYLGLENTIQRYKFFLR